MRYRTGVSVMSKKEPKVAIVHDWLVGYAGGDRVVDAMKRVFPDAVIYTLVYDPNNMPEHFKSYHYLRFCASTEPL